MTFRQTKSSLRETWSRRQEVVLSCFEAKDSLCQTALNSRETVKYWSYHNNHNAEAEADSRDLWGWEEEDPAEPDGRVQLPHQGGVPHRRGLWEVPHVPEGQGGGQDQGPCVQVPQRWSQFSWQSNIPLTLTTLGYLFSSSGARCQPEATVACHRSQPLASLMSHAMSRGDLFLLP